MLNPARDREQLHALLSGELGEFTELYGNIAVAGTVSQLRNSVEAMLGLYADDPQLRYYDIGATSVDAQWFLERIQGYELSSDYADVLAEQHALLHAEHPNWREPEVQQRLWRDTQQAFSRLDLPVSFVSYQVSLEGEPTVAFWYPRLVPAEAMLKVFKLATRQTRSA